MRLGAFAISCRMVESERQVPQSLCQGLCARGGGFVAHQDGVQLVEFVSAPGEARNTRRHPD